MRSYAVSHPGGWLDLPQDPAWSQLVYAVHGVLTVHTPDGSWVVPPHRAAWVPAGAFGAAFRAELGATPAHWFSR